MEKSINSAPSSDPGKKPGKGPGMIIAYVILGLIVVSMGYSGLRFMHSFGPGGSRDDGVDYVARHDSIIRVQDSLKAAQKMAYLAAAMDTTQHEQADTLRDHAGDANALEGMGTDMAEPSAAPKVGANQLWIMILVTLLLIVVPSGTVIDISRKKFPRGKTIFWVIAVFLLPVLGTLVYFLVGRRMTDGS